MKLKLGIQRHLQMGIGSRVRFSSFCPRKDGMIGINQLSCAATAKTQVLGCSGAIQ
jgi:hypothetical protein